MTKVDPQDQRLHWRAPLGLAARAGGFAPRRFPQDVSDQAAVTHPGPASRMECVSGCSLLMRTDASTLACDIEVIDTPRDFGEFVARVAGNVIGSWREMAFKPGPCRFEIELKGGGSMRNVEVLLPHNLKFVFISLAVDGEVAAGAALPAPPVWLALGDSITQGMNAVSPSSTYVQRICDALSIGAWNLGVGGATMEPSLFSWALGAQPWRMVTVALGSNDCIGNAGLDAFCGKTREMIDCISARAPQARVIFITPPPAAKAGGTLSRLGEYREAIAATVAESGNDYVVVDGLSLVDPARGHFTPDGVHLSDEGFGAYARRLIDVMKAL